jgi:hypothetical protein
LPARPRWHNRFNGRQLFCRIGSNVDFRRGQIAVALTMERPDRNEYPQIELASSSAMDLE